MILTPARIRHFARGALACLGMAALASCTDSSQPLAPRGGPAALVAPAGSTVQAYSGNNQVAVAGDTLPSMNVIRVLGPTGAPLANVTVHWTVTNGGGTLVLAGGTTNSTGRAYARWKLGTVVGYQTLAADAEGAGSVTFTGRAIPANSRVEIVSGNGQTAPADSLLPGTLRVRVVEPTGTPIPGAQAMWTVLSGGGTLTWGVASVANADGVAFNALKLGPVPGEQRVRATVRGLAPVEFTATASLAGAKVALYAGNGQSGTPPDTLTRSLVVRLTRADGTPIEGATVNWATPNGGGFRYPRTVTNSTGRAYNLWALGRTKVLGTQQATATVQGVGTVTFTATAVANNRVLTVISGSGQSGYAGDSLPAPLVMRVTDPAGLPIRGVQVKWRVATGGGGLRTLTGYTDPDGRAVNRWVPGAVLGQQEVRAAVAGSGEVAFTATVVAYPGAQIAYRSNRLGGGSRVWMIRPDGTGRYALPTTWLAEQPDWSPDGTRIVFTQPTGTERHVSVMNADGTGMAPLVTFAGNQTSPSWSPAGDRIAFSGDGPSGAGIYVINVNGTGLALLRSGGTGPAWSPDGSRIAYAGGPAEPGLWIMDADGTDPVKINGFGSLPSWSPDGTRIAFQGPSVGDDYDENSIQVIAATGGTPVLLTHGSDPDWSPDGLRLAFTYNGTLYMRNVDGPGQQVMLDGGSGIHNYAPAWKPVH